MSKSKRKVAPSGTKVHVPFEPRGMDYVYTCERNNTTVDVCLGLPAAVLAMLVWREKFAPFSDVYETSPDGAKRVVLKSPSKPSGQTIGGLSGDKLSLSN